MKPGQVLTQWWQDFAAGRLRTPQSIVAASRAENVDPALSGVADRFFNEPQDGFLWEAPMRLSAPSFILSEGHIRQGEKADWQHCDRRLMRWAAVFIELARKRGIPLYVHCAFRSEADQADMIKRGVSRARYPHSAHNVGEAVDIVHGVYHWTVTKQEWALLHLLGRRALHLVNGDLPKARRLDLNWGGTFEGLYDPAHWEIADYRSRIKRLPYGPPLRMMPRTILVSMRL